MNGPDFEDLVRRARSVRRFVESDPMPPEAVRRLVDLARLSPSAGNQQPLRYRIVTDPQERARVFPLTQWAGLLKGWGGPAEGERPTAYLAILVDRDKPPSLDVGIAAEIVQLAATAMGYAACMIGSIERDELHRTLGLPVSLSVRLLIALGRPAERVILEDMPANGSTAYWRDANEIHHVPKRSLDDVLIV